VVGIGFGGGALVSALRCSLWTWAFARADLADLSLTARVAAAATVIAVVGEIDARLSAASFAGVAASVAVGVTTGAAGIRVPAAHPCGEGKSERDGFQGGRLHDRIDSPRAVRLRADA
jgi:hypothetical protein